MNCRALSKKNKEANKMKRIDKIIYEKTKQQMEKRTKAFDSCVLLTLHEIEGYGKKRLETFYKTFIDTFEYLCNKYEMGDVVITKLKQETGVDIDELYDLYVEDSYENPESNYRVEIENKNNEIEDLQKENEILKEQIKILMNMNNIKI